MTCCGKARQRANNKTDHRRNLSGQKLKTCTRRAIVMTSVRSVSTAVIGLIDW